MRKFALVNKKVVVDTENGYTLKKCMVYQTPEGEVFLFLYNSAEDVFGVADYWFSSLEEAERLYCDVYGVMKDDWVEVQDPLPLCQHDIIAPVRW